VEHVSSDRERNLILASRSPRRRALLESVGFRPRVIPADVPEEPRAGETPADYTLRLSRLKAEAVAVSDQVSDPTLSPWILGADTVVVVDDDILEKPTNAENAEWMLGRLSDRWHTVMTSFSVCGLGATETVSRTIATEVRFKPLSSDAIQRYVRSGEPMDKAGAYGIQELGSALVKEVRGSFFAVVGLPVCEVVEVLLSLGAVTGFPFEDRGAA
jgi:septum formation protein